MKRSLALAGLVALAGAAAGCTKKNTDGGVKNTTSPTGAGAPASVAKPAPLNAPEAGCDVGGVYGKDVCNWGEFPADHSALVALTKPGSDFARYAALPTEAEQDKETDGLTPRYGLAGGVVLAAMKDLFDKHLFLIGAATATQGGYPWPGNTLTDVKAHESRVLVPAGGPGLT